MGLSTLLRRSPENSSLHVANSLRRSDCEVLEAFLNLVSAGNERLQVLAGRTHGLESIAVLWLDGHPVAYAHRKQGEVQARAYAGAMDTDKFALEAREYLFECSGEQAHVQTYTSLAPLRAYAGDLNQA